MQGVPTFLEEVVLLACGWRDVQNWKVNCRAEFYKNYSQNIGHTVEIVKVC